MRRLLAFFVLAGCGPQAVPLKSGTYAFEGLRGRDGAPSAAVTASQLELDVLTREVKLTVSNATRKFLLSQDSTVTLGCEKAGAQDTRTLDAPNVQLGEFLFDAPLVRADCPAGSGVIVFQQGPLGPEGAPACSSEVLCLSYRLPSR